MSKTEGRLLSLQDTASRLGTTVRTIQRLIRSGALGVVRLPGVRRTLIDEADLAALVMSARREARSQD